MEVAARILQLIEPAPAGGAESVVRALCVAARRHGVEMDAALLGHGNGPIPLATTLERDGVPVHEIRCGRRHYLREIAAVARLLASGEPTVVHTHVYHADLVGFAAARRRRARVVATVHGFTDGSVRNRLYQAVDLRVLRRFDAVICVSEAIADRVRSKGVAAERVQIVANAIAQPRLLGRDAARDVLGVSREGPIVGWVGRLSPEKAPERLLEILGGMADPPQAVIVGEGPMRPELERQAYALGVAHRVAFAGAVPDAGNLMRAFDFLALTSRTEGIPIVLLEAMAAEVPIVAFGVGGVPQVVERASAWIVAPDDLAAFRAALEAALTDPNEAASRASVAKEHVRTRFDVDGWFSKIQAVYRRVLET